MTPELAGMNNTHWVTIAGMNAINAGTDTNATNAGAGAVITNNKSPVTGPTQVADFLVLWGRLSRRCRKV